MRKSISSIIEGLDAMKISEASSKNYVTVVKYPKGMSDKDCIDAVSHVFGAKHEDMSLNKPEFEGMNIKIAGISKDGSYDIEILKSQNKGNWNPSWTKELKKYNATSYNNGFMLTGFKSSNDLKAAAKRIEDSKKSLASAEVEAVKKYIGKDLTKHKIYDYEENDYLIKFVIQYESGDTKQVDANYILYDTDFDEVLDPMG